MDDVLNFEDYAKKSIYYSSNEKPALHPEVEKIINECKKRFKTVSVFDIGCGDGNFLNSIAENVKDVKLYGSDISKTRLDRTIKKLNGKVDALYLYDASATSINQKVEFINSDQVIEHVPSDIQMVENMYKMLKPKGMFKVSSVYKTGFSWYFYRCNGKWVLDPTHVREYESIVEFKKLFTDNGLKINSVKITPIYFSGIDFILRKIGITNPGPRVDYLKRIINKIKIHKPGYYIITVIGENS